MKVNLVGSNAERVRLDNIQEEVWYSEVGSRRTTVYLKLSDTILKMVDGEDSIEELDPDNLEEEDEDEIPQVRRIPSGTKLEITV